MESIIVDTSQKEEIDFITLQKMKFIYNAIDDGWSVKLNKNNYVFSKKHEGKKEIYLKSYLHDFIKTNSNN